MPTIKPVPPPPQTNAFGQSLPLPEDQDYLGMGTQALLGLLGLGNDEVDPNHPTGYGRANRLGQLISAGLPVIGAGAAMAAPLVAGVKPEYIPFLRLKAKQMVDDVIANGMPQRLNEGAIDRNVRRPLTPTMSEALRYAYARYPRVMGHITDIAALEPRMQETAGGQLVPHSINPKFSVLELHPEGGQTPATLGHEMLHAADAITQPDMLERYNFFNSLPGGYAANSMEVRARGMGDTFAAHFQNYINTAPPNFQLIDTRDDTALPQFFSTRGDAIKAMATLSPNYKVYKIPGSGNYHVFNSMNDKAVMRFPSMDEAKAYIASIPENYQRFFSVEPYDHQEMKIPNSRRKNSYAWDKGQLVPPEPIPITTPNDSPTLANLIQPPKD